MFFDSFFRISTEIIAFFYVEEIFNMRKVFFYLFSKGVDIYCKKILAFILFLPNMAPKTFLIVLVLFILALMGERWLFPTRYINKRDVSKFIFSEIFIFFYANLQPWKHLALIFWVLEGGYNNAFTFVLTVFSAILSQKSTGI